MRQWFKPAQLTYMTVESMELTITEALLRVTGARQLFRLQCCCSVLHCYPLLHLGQEGSRAREQYKDIISKSKKQNTAVFPQILLGQA